MKIDNQTQLFISAALKPGNFGASIYNRLFEHYGMNTVYLPKKVLNAKSLVTVVRALDIKGCSVTMPYKSQVIPLLDEIDEVAERTMSVNTIVNESGRLVGRNTDHYGALIVLKGLQSKSVLVYGAGSVVNSIVLALQDLGCPDIALHARRSKAAQAIAERHCIEALNHQEVRARCFELLINATPTSNLEKNEVFSVLDRAGSLFDLMVAPSETKLCNAAQNRGMKVTAGIEMSKWQLQKQFYHYTGLLPDMEQIDKIIDCVYKQT